MIPRHPHFFRRVLKRIFHFPRPTVIDKTVSSVKITALPGRILERTVLDENVAAVDGVVLEAGKVESADE
jgi:hypothetical protein